MRAPEESPFEMRVPEVGLFKIAPLRSRDQALATSRFRFRSLRRLIAIKTAAISLAGLLQVRLAR
jgi:hypothetical protein